jgi:hypothetical protein
MNWMITWMWINEFQNLQTDVCIFFFFIKRGTSSYPRHKELDRIKVDASTLLLFKQ